MYLCAYIFKRRRTYQREADEKDVRLRVRQRSEPVVVLLASRVPQAQVDGLSIDHDISGVVVEAA